MTPAAKEPSKGSGIPSFALPVIHYLVTADGPACFDITADVPGLADETVRIMGCDCPCECICLCPCECLCQNPCDCMCLCMCLCIVTSSTDQRLASEPGSFASGIMLSISPNLHLRPESYGGLAFNRSTFASYVCNESAYLLLSAIGEFGRLPTSHLHYLPEIVKAKYGEVPEQINEIVVAFVANCLKKGFLIT